MQKSRLAIILILLTVGILGCSTNRGENRLVILDLGKADVKVPEEWRNGSTSYSDKDLEIIFHYANNREDIPIDFSILDTSVNDSDPFEGIENLINDYWSDSKVIKNEKREEATINGTKCKYLDFEGIRMDDNGQPSEQIRAIQAFYPDLGYRFDYYCFPLKNQAIAEAIGVDINSEEMQQQYVESIEIFYSIMNSLESG